MFTYLNTAPYKNQHAELKKHTDLQICSVQTFDQYKLIQSQNTQNDPFNNWIGQV